MNKKVGIVPKDKWNEELETFISNNKITEIENVLFFIYFGEFSGIIFYIPQEQCYGCEILWELGESMWITFGAYSTYLNQIFFKLEKELENHLNYFENLLENI